MPKEEYSARHISANERSNVATNSHLNDDDAVSLAHLVSANRHLHTTTTHQMPGTSVFILFLIFCLNKDSLLTYLPITSAKVQAGEELGACEIDVAVLNAWDQCCIRNHNSVQRTKINADMQCTVLLADWEEW